MRPALASPLLGLVLVLSGCASGPDSGDLPSSEDAADDQVAAVATGLDTVWSIAFSSDGRIFITERPGRVRVIDAEGALVAAAWNTPRSAEQGESGLMGLALHPRFPDDPRVYLYYSYVDAVGTLKNKVVVLTERNGRGADERVVLDGIPGLTIHDGGRLAFGPDGFLYITTGDAGVPANSQDRSSLAGKVLRLDAEGRVPSGNPTPGSPVFTLGHRNPQGIAFRPGTGVPFITEHGPENHDEVNVLVADGNYGWPLARGPSGAPAFRGSVWTSGEGGTIAPAGAAFIQAPSSPLDGAFIFGNLKGQHLRLLTLDRNGAPTDEHELFAREFGRIRAVTWHDGALYIGTSNKDGRGQPGPTDDRIVRIPLGALEEAVRGA